jgi:predicted transcriptional regulator
MNQTNPPDLDLTSITADIVSSYVANNAVHRADLPAVIASVHAALQGLVAPKQAEPAKQLQASIAIRKSVTPDFLVSLEDGKKYKTLKRHLGKLGLTPAQYRAKWGLPDDYPIVAPNYALRRSELARSSGLGQKRRKTAAKSVAMSDEAVTTPAEVSKPQRRTPSRKKSGG